MNLRLFARTNDADSGWYDPSAPEVSIVVLNLNNSDLTRECLEHIWAHTEGRRYEIIVVDNGSSYQEFRKLADFPGKFRLLRIPVNRFFGEGNNIGVEASRGKYVVFLNNDAFVTKNWLDPLVLIFETESNVGGVGAKLLYPGGRLQEAGAFVDDKGIAIQRGKYYSTITPDINANTIVDYCSAACFLTSRNIFDRVCGFDPIFEPAYYEDVDICLKIACLGLYIYFCSDSEVYHLENGTSSNPALKVSLGLDNLVEHNRKKLLTRWGAHLSMRGSDNVPPCPSLPWRRPRERQCCDSKQGTAVFHTPYDLVPGGGERYILTAALALRETHRVFLATEAPYSEYRLDHLGHELSLNLAGISIVRRQDLFQCGPIDLFVCMANAAWPYSPAQGKRNLYVCQFPFPSDDAYLANHWEYTPGYDGLIVYSEFSRDCLRKKISPFHFDVPITILAPPVPIQSTHTGSKQLDRPIILSIGRFFEGGHNKRHDILIDAVRRLAEDGFKGELHFIGTVHVGHLDHYYNLQRKAEGLPIKFHANAGPDVLSDLLSRAIIYWHATGFEIDPNVSPEKCEHFGISVLEAMAAGCVPLVVSNGGPTEFVREKETGFQYSTIEELVSKTKQILEDPLGLAAISAAAVGEAQRFSEAVFIEKWRRIGGSQQIFSVHRPA